MKSHEPMNGPYLITFFLFYPLFNAEKILLHTLMSDHSFVSCSGQDMWASHQFSERSGWGNFPAESSSQICFIHRIFLLVLLVCKVSTMTLKQLEECSHMSLDLDSHQQTFFCWNGVSVHIAGTCGLCMILLHVFQLEFFKCSTCELATVTLRHVWKRQLWWVAPAPLTMLSVRHLGYAGTDTQWWGAFTSIERVLSVSIPAYTCTWQIWNQDLSCCNLFTWGGGDWNDSLNSVTSQ